jgi:hypothetical protein
MIIGSMPIHLKREALYTEVWRRPIGYLARDFGVTTATVRAAFKTLAVPLPAVGYWAALRAGKAPQAVPLRPHEGACAITLDGHPRETLAEWVVRTSGPAQKPQRAKPPTATSIANHAGPRLVPIAAWASMVFGEHAPHSNTLLRWVHDGRIQPQPTWIGRKWFVKPDAEYTSD